MRDYSHPNGSVSIEGDDGDTDRLHAVAKVRSFKPVAGARCSTCGASLQTWAPRSTGTCAVELNCNKCFQTVATIELEVITSRRTA